MPKKNWQGHSTACYYRDVFFSSFDFKINGITTKISLHILHKEIFIENDTSINGRAATSQGKTLPNTENLASDTRDW